MDSGENCDGDSEHDVGEGEGVDVNVRCDSYDGRTERPDDS